MCVLLFVCEVLLEFMFEKKRLHFWAKMTMGKGVLPLFVEVSVNKIRTKDYEFYNPRLYLSLQS